MPKTHTQNDSADIFDNDDLKTAPTGEVIDITEQLEREQADNAQPQPWNVTPDANGFAFWNDAEILGEQSRDFDDFMRQEATLTTGVFYKAKSNRNTQDGGWTGLTKSWREWLEGNPDDGWGLTRHFENKHKVGSIYVYASTVEKARTAKSVDKIYALALDIDAGTKLDDVLERIEELGLLAIVSTSHSHGKTIFEIPRDEIVKALGAAENFTDDQIQTFLRDFSKQHYDDDFILTATITEQNRRTKTGSQIVFKTAPLDKFRVIFPLAVPVDMASLGDTDKAALDLFESKIIGLAVDLLDAVPDVSCTDPCRMMYGPRHPKGAEWYAAVVRGRPLTFEEVPTRNKSDYVKSLKSAHNPFTQAGVDSDKLLTPNGVDLKALWHKIKDRFMFAELIETECPDKLRDDPGKQGWIQLECPFESDHGTINSNDTSTWVVDALDSATGNFQGGCRHHTCEKEGRGALELLHKMLHDNWFPEDLLNDDSPYILESDDDSDDTANSDTSEFEPVKDWLPYAYTINSGKIWREPTDADVKAFDKAFKKAQEKVSDDEINEKDLPEPPKDVEICGAFDLVGRSSNADYSQKNGLIISFVNVFKKRVEMTIPWADIHADPRAVVRDLADRGLPLPVGRQVQFNLAYFLNKIEPKRQIPTMNVPGWVRDEHGDIVGFLQCTGVYQPVGDNTPVRLLEGSKVKFPKPKGTFEGWSGGAQEVLTYADTNFYWPLGLISGFPGPLLGILEWLPVGFSFSGMTSQGKTMALIMATSVWTTPQAGNGLMHSGNTTGNAVEDNAIKGTDGIFCCDEIGAMTDKKALSSVVMSLSTGSTKSRKAGRGIGLAEQENFRPFALFSSEMGMKNEINAVGEMFRGGLAVRFPDIDVTDGVQIEADELKKIEVFESHYGHAALIYIQYLIDSGVFSDRAKLEGEVLAIASKLAKGKGSAMHRAARVFALAQRGGELAADAGLLGDVEAAKASISTAVEKAWSVYLTSEEAGAAKGGSSIIETLQSFITTRWDLNIIAAGDGKTVKEPAVEDSDGNVESKARIRVQDADNTDARGGIIGWYDDDTIYLDWQQLDNPAKLGLSVGSRKEMVKALNGIDAVWPKSDDENPHSSLPPSVAALTDGAGRTMKNLRIHRNVIGI